MSVREIPTNEWENFLEEFSRGHRAWLATIDHVSPASGRRVEAVERPLHSVTPTTQAGSVVSIEIHFQEDSLAREPVRIDAPLKVRVDESTDGSARGLEIVDEDGECTRLSFRASPRPEMLDGIAPGELSPE